MSNLVIVEHDNNEVAAATLHAVTAAQQIGGDIDLLVAGENCAAVAEAAAGIAGVSKVKVADNPAFGHHLAENVASLIVEQANNGNQTVPTLVFADGSAQTNPSLAQVKEKLAALV